MVWTVKLPFLVGVRVPKCAFGRREMRRLAVRIGVFDLFKYR